MFCWTSAPLKREALPEGEWDKQCAVCDSGENIRGGGDVVVFLSFFFLFFFLF
jgi:hypothetical protein